MALSKRRPAPAAAPASPAPSPSPAPASSPVPQNVQGPPPPPSAPPPLPIPLVATEPPAAPKAPPPIPSAESAPADGSFGGFILPPEEIQAAEDAANGVEEVPFNEFLQRPPEPPAPPPPPPPPPKKGRLGSLKKRLSAGGKTGGGASSAPPSGSPRPGKGTKAGRGGGNSRRNLVLVLLLLLVFLAVVWFYVVPAFLPSRPAAAPKAKDVPAVAEPAKEDAAPPMTKGEGTGQEQAAIEDAGSPAEPEEPPPVEPTPPPSEPSPSTPPSVEPSPGPSSTGVASRATTLLGRALEAARSAAEETSALLGAGEDAKKKEEAPKPVEPAPVPQWPKIEVYAVIIQGNGGTALVNGSVLSIGEATPDGAVLRAVAPQCATFEWRGERRVFYTVAAPKSEPPDKQKGKKGLWGNKK